MLLLVIAIYVFDCCESDVCTKRGCPHRTLLVNYLACPTCQLGHVHANESELIVVLCANSQMSIRGRREMSMRSAMVENAGLSFKLHSAWNRHNGLC